MQRMTEDGGTSSRGRATLAASPCEASVYDPAKRAVPDATLGGGLCGDRATLGTPASEAARALESTVPARERGRER